jgi:hypothetical protein
MRRTTVVLAALMGATTAGGCSIAGSWRTIAVDPPGAPFPVDRVTFDRDDNYTATGSREGETRTSTGRYRWNWFKLDVLEPGGQPRTYSAQRRLDGKLVLTYKEGRGKVTATLAKVDE